jgi:hypothetical protein
MLLPSASSSPSKLMHEAGANAGVAAALRTNVHVR